MNAPLKTHQTELIDWLQETVSASRLKTFMQCRLKFFFRYVMEIEQSNSPALHVGSVIHSTLEAWNKARWKGTPLSTTQLHQEFAKAWVEQQEEDIVLWENDESAHMQTAWRLLETYIRETPIPVNQKPDAVEVSVRADLSKHGLPKLVGVIDLVQRGIIIDYKTASSTPNPDSVAHLNEIQTSIYAILYREAKGSIENGFELHHLVKLKSPKIVVTPLPPMNQQQESRLFRCIQSYQHGLSVRDFVPSPGMGCLSCEFYGACRNWS